MAEFFRTSEIWVVEFTYDGRPRRWFKAFAQGADVAAKAAALIQDLYDKRGRLVSVRPATPDEETQYVRGTLPKNVLCPTGRGPVGRRD